MEKDAPDSFWANDKDANPENISRNNEIMIDILIALFRWNRALLSNFSYPPFIRYSPYSNQNNLFFSPTWRNDIDHEENHDDEHNNKTNCLKTHALNTHPSNDNKSGSSIASTIQRKNRIASAPSIRRWS